MLGLDDGRIYPGLKNFASSLPSQLPKSKMQAMGTKIQGQSSAPFVFFSLYFVVHFPSIPFLLFPDRPSPLASQQGGSGWTSRFTEPHYLRAVRQCC